MGIGTIMIIVFIIGYLAIVLEHNVKVDKAASALLIGMICWAIYAVWPAESLSVDPNKSIAELANDPQLKEDNKAFSTYLGEEIHMNELHALEVSQDPATAQAEAEAAPTHGTSETIKHYVEHGLVHHLFDIAGILFFLLGAMTIVEVIDGHDGFSVITQRISTLNKVKLLWVVTIITFFMSSALDNLTTAIVMVSVIRKLIDDKQTRWIFGGFIIISANAGGAWSPIGDVTTTMLWNNGQLPDSAYLMGHLFIPSLMCILLPLIAATFFMRGNVKRPEKLESNGHSVSTANWEKNLVFGLGLAGLLFVPVFKTITHLPPFMGMLLSLGILWAITELLHAKKDGDHKNGLTIVTVLRRIDTASVLFFLGILMAVAALQEVGHLAQAAKILDTTFNQNVYSINVSIGVLSAIIDNVPLVAAAQGMYPVSTGAFEANGMFWQLLAFCAGTGGSILIIGSAAGVAVMGLEKMDFIWYLKRISLYALLGYLGGVATYYIMYGTV
jgi:Na+/H+ antiporter NhaD/arsenite permease-like protein